jgi:hypothetical protein
VKLTPIVDVGMPLELAGWLMGYIDGIASSKRELLIIREACVEAVEAARKVDV